MTPTLRIDNTVLYPMQGTVYIQDDFGNLVVADLIGWSYYLCGE